VLRENTSRALVEAIDDAIERAEDLGLTFVTGILMMARLETVQTAIMTLEERGSGQHP
jgi:hypothetical protein